MFTPSINLSIPMKKFIYLFSFVIVVSLFVSVPLKAFQTEPTKLIFVRHTEKGDDGTRNPPLNEEGLLRAENLYRVITADYELKAIYSTAYKRTEMTAKPVSDSLGIEIQNYKFDGLEELFAKIIKDNAGYSVLIVGHSNTTPSLVNMVLGEQRFEQIDDSKYGDLFVVTTTKLGSGEVTVSEF